MTEWSDIPVIVAYASTQTAVLSADEAAMVSLWRWSGWMSNTVMIMQEVSERAVFLLAPPTGPRDA